MKKFNKGRKKYGLENIAKVVTSLVYIACCLNIVLLINCNLSNKSVQQYKRNKLQIVCSLNKMGMEVFRFILFNPLNNFIPYVDKKLSCSVSLTVKHTLPKLIHLDEHDHCRYPISVPV